VPFLAELLILAMHTNGQFWQAETIKDYSLE
jgi:hypothetical protein